MAVIYNYCKWLFSQLFWNSCYLLQGSLAPKRGHLYKSKNGKRKRKQQLVWRSVKTFWKIQEKVPSHASEVFLHLYKNLVINLRGSLVVPGHRGTRQCRFKYRDKSKFVRAPTEGARSLASNIYWLINSTTCSGNRSHTPNTYFVFEPTIWKIQRTK